MPVLLVAPAETCSDLLEQLGNISPKRVRMIPPPGTAEVEDVTCTNGRSGRLYELIDGTLVEKAKGFEESNLAMELSGFINAFVKPRNLGIVTGEAGTYRLMPDLVRIPDVAFISWDRLPGRRRPLVPPVAPDLAVEVLSEGNTESEMERKRRDYFGAGVRLVWIADPVARTVRVFTGPDAETTLTRADTLDGGDVLPGFTLSLAVWFGDLDRHG